MASIVPSSHPVPTPSGRGVRVPPQPRPTPYRDGVGGRTEPRSKDIDPVPSRRGFKIVTAPRTYAMTKAEYDALDLSRPLTDSPIGAATTRRRQMDADISAGMPTTPNPGGPR
jgi:hypothetical protein